MSEAGPAILIVDDNEDNRYTLGRRLKRHGYENVGSAAHGREALDLMAERSWDLVLLDIMMPELNGYEVLERMKADPKLRDVPVLMISALDEIDSVVRCIELGAADYLAKPFNATLLRARVGACLDEKRLRDREADHLARLENERKRYDDLLRAVLPAEGVREFRESGAVRPRRFEDVAVLYCRIGGFDERCDRVPPERAVAEMQGLMGRLDGIALEHGIARIKAAGDLYLAAAGLPHATPDPVLEAVRCGLDMAAAADAGSGWRIRIGIHSGSVVAGALGDPPCLYDLWGETVRIAAAVAEGARPGRVAVTGESWARVPNGGRQPGPVPPDVDGEGRIDLVERPGSRQA